SKRRSALRNLPPAIYAVYRPSIIRIEKSGRRGELGMKALMWAYLAARSLKPIELCHALSVVDSGQALDSENIPSVESVLECCCGLVMVDQETSTVRLAHYTLQEYLHSHFEEYYPTGHLLIARTCLTYLNFTALSTAVSDSALHRLRADYALLDYAVHEWGYH
ncbi:hypothetical protein BDZ91DRAFT_615770, partial [Kalaharituber pfeilii]